jgi:hypothetical protein
MVLPKERGHGADDSADPNEYLIRASEEGRALAAHERQRALYSTGESQPFPSDWDYLASSAAYHPPYEYDAEGSARD